MSLPTAIDRVASIVKPIGATVTKISVLADSNQRWFNPDLKEYPVDLVLDETPKSLKPGMGANVEILVNHLDNVLAVSGGFNPAIALTSHLGAQPRWSDKIAAFVPGTTASGMKVVGAANGSLALAACLRDGAAAGAEASGAQPPDCPTVDDDSDALSPTCASNYLKIFDAIQKRIAARVTVANACTREIVKLCGGSTKETSKSIPCLTTTQGVSPRCIQAMDDAGYR